MNFGPNGPDKIITRSDLKASVHAYEELLSKSAAYRQALLAMSKATAQFADAMETCATLQGPTYESGTRLQAASGLHHLMSNHWHILADTLDKQFEKPLRQHLDSYRSIVTERSNSYEKALREKSRAIRQTERENMQRKGRNLQTFREALAILQRQVDELDDLKAQHYQEIVEHEEQVWDEVQGKTCLLLRSTLDVFDRLTSKASDPIIEPMLQAVPDPFDSYGPPPDEDKIFSILPPLSVIANTPSASPSPLTSSTPDLEGSSDGKNSWTNTGGFFPDTAAAWGHVPTSPTMSPTSSATVISPSVSPPTVSRRHSVPFTPSISAHSTRKSESKLRSVLAVIDESRSQHVNGESGEATPVVRSTSEATTVGAYANGTSDRHDSESPWGPPRLPSDPPDLRDDITPRGSVRIPSSSPSPPVPDVVFQDRTMLSPRSDLTAIPSS
ncbi:Protein IVY1 [Phanerochaete sordida]|uniref:Protein IVY1 n=1 Tax=Phanerochaete sordida TaxID=48140 RepID=A0A9P3FYE4_9APHY|nr:Protein IVY1 [Phanerochaete sordida]